ncbi:cystatin-A-like [Apodemus sylvaticus]|uniref:cystatin-A-like n=1 Tax=Apodemus sylvaticus TaxID=10129 RepID=UPI00224399C5|nr:cystatin-A-like [Apodemus sylvaticus]
MMPGGLTKARPATEKIQEIADKVRPQLEKEINERYEKFEAVEYKTQVVAGVNFFIKVNVGNGSFTHIKVFQGLGGEDDLELTGYQTNKTEEDELNYF